MECVAGNRCLIFARPVDHCCKEVCIKYCFYYFQMLSNECNCLPIDGIDDNHFVSNCVNQLTHFYLFFVLIIYIWILIMKTAWSCGLHATQPMTVDPLYWSIVLLLFLKSSNGVRLLAHWCVSFIYLYHWLFVSVLFIIFNVQLHVKFVFVEVVTTFPFATHCK